MKEKIDSFIQELDGIDLVLDKLETKSNVSVFEKLCSNCDRVFTSFCELDVKEIVNSGYGKKSIEFLKKLKKQVVRLKNYKVALTDYINIANGNSLPNITSINNQAAKIQDEANKQLTLVNEEGKAA